MLVYGTPAGLALWMNPDASGAVTLTHPASGSSITFTRSEGLVTAVAELSEALHGNGPWTGPMPEGFAPVEPVANLATAHGYYLVEFAPAGSFSAGCFTEPTEAARITTLWTTDAAPPQSSPTPPPLASILLRHATGLVLDASASAVYSTWKDGRASDTAIASALTEAVYAQAEAWALAGIDPRPGSSSSRKRALAAKSLGGASWTYEGRGSREATAADELASGEVLTAAAVRILTNAGLLSTRIRPGAYGDGHPLGIVHVGETPYNPVTGAITPEQLPEVYT